MYNFIFLLYSLAGERTVTVGECSTGDIAIFLILSRKKMKTGAITSALPYYVRGRAITIFLELEAATFLLKYGSYAWRHGKNAYPVAIIPMQNKYS